MKMGGVPHVHRVPGQGQPEGIFQGGVQPPPGQAPLPQRFLFYLKFSATVVVIIVRIF